MRRDDLSALDFNYLEASRIFVAFAKAGEYRERRDVAIVCCGLPAEALNFGFLKPPYDDLEASAAAVQAYFADRKLPFNLALRSAEPEGVVEALAARGWRRKLDPTPGMTLALPAAIPEPPASLAIQEVRSLEELVAFREVAFRGFGYPAAIAHLFLTDQLVALPQVRLYAGRVDGVVVATSMLITTGSIAGIYWVATLEDQRGRGFGEAVTWAAVRGGNELGCEVASLQASKFGRPVYTRMGFSHALDYVHFLPPEA